MKLITLWEPWSTLMATGHKKIETRHWSTNYRGWLAIHSAKGGLPTRELHSMCAEPHFKEALPQPCFSFPFGHIIAVCKLVGCLPTESLLCLPGVFDDHPELDNPQERAFGNYDPGRYGLVTENVFKLPQPIPFKSRQGKLLKVPEEIIDEIQRQARASEVPFSCPA